jgi:hypothetical protein
LFLLTQKQRIRNHSQRVGACRCDHRECGFELLPISHIDEMKVIPSDRRCGRPEYHSESAAVANTTRMFVIGSGVGATQVCAVVAGGNNAATTRCTTY